MKRLNNYPYSSNGSCRGGGGGGAGGYIVAVGHFGWPLCIASVSSLPLTLLGDGPGKKPFVCRVQQETLPAWITQNLVPLFPSSSIAFPLCFLSPSHVS